MTSLFTKRKMFIIATCLFLVTMSTVLFLVGGDKLDIEHHELQAFVLQDEAIKTPQSEEYYRDLLHVDDDDLFILKADTTIQFSTENWRVNFGYKSDEINGQNFFTLVHPKDLPFFANEMVELVNHSETKSNIGPFRIKDSKEEYKLYMADGIPLKDNHKETVGIALILTDVSIPLGGSSGIPSAFAFGTFPI